MNIQKNISGFEPVLWEAPVLFGFYTAVKFIQGKGNDYTCKDTESIDHCGFKPGKS